MTLQELISRAQAALQPRLAERAIHRQTIVNVESRCTSEGNRNPTLSESRDVAAARAALIRIDTETATQRADLERWERELADDNAQAAAATRTTPTGVGLPPDETSSSTGTRSRDVYAVDRDRTGERSYFADMYRSEVLHDVGAGQRVAQHMAERSTGSSAYAGLVPPEYLIEQAALVARAGRPFANSILSLPIPDQGMSLLLPRSTTGSSAAVQATENSTVSATDEVWANVTLPVATIAGQATPSRQSLERGAPGLDALIFADIAGAYGVALDAQALSGTGSSGQVLGALATSGIGQSTAFGAAATVSTFYTKVAGQISAISAARGLPPDSIAMHPRRYAWLLAQLDGQNRPLVTPAPEQGPMNVMGVTGAAPSYGTSAGTFLGLQIIVDANLPTSVGTGPEDQVLVYRAADLILYEDDPLPRQLRFEQTAGTALTVTLVAYGYMAFTAGRYPTALGIIGGNAGTAGFGLVAPTF